MTNVTETAGVNTYYTELAYDKNGNQLMKRHSSVTDETGEPEYGAEANSEYAEYRYNLFGQLTEMQHGDVTYGYDAFGNQQDSTTDTNPFRYCGEYWDNESGLVYLRARYYDAGIGAFTSADTHWNVSNMIYGDNNIGVPSIAAMMQSGNLYVYCVNNPVNFVDPWGLEMDGDERYSELKQTMLRYLGKTWNKANETWKREAIHQVADRLRNFDDNSFDRLIYMNDSDGAEDQGHAGILLLNSAGEGLLFSFYPTSEELSDVMNVDAEMRFAVLSNEDAYSLIKVNGKVEYAAASDGDIIFSENYDRFAYYDITNNQGIQMFNTGAWLYDNPGTYNLIGRQCDNIANQIMSAAGYGYTVQWRPNATYDVLSQGRASWSL